MTSKVNWVKDFKSQCNIEIRASSEQEIYNVFPDKNDLVLSDELRQYFLNINGYKNEYDDNFFRFFSLEHFKSIEEYFADWNGIPAYKDLFKSLANYNDYYIIADYQCYFTVYLVLLSHKATCFTPVIAAIGGDYKKVANSFSDFIVRYLKNPDDLLF